MKKITILSITLLFITVSFSQTWEENALNKNTNANFFELKNSFDEYRENITYTKGNGYKPYARTIDFLESRVDENGNFPSSSL